VSSRYHRRDGVENAMLGQSHHVWREISVARLEHIARQPTSDIGRSTNGGSLGEDHRVAGRKRGGRKQSTRAFQYVASRRSRSVSCHRRITSGAGNRFVPASLGP
jgi:hypothetical protein